VTKNSQPRGGENVHNVCLSFFWNALFPIFQKFTILKKRSKNSQKLCHLPDRFLITIFFFQNRTNDEIPRSLEHHLHNSEHGTTVQHHRDFRNCFQTFRKAISRQTLLQTSQIGRWWRRPRRSIMEKGKYC